MTRVQWILEEIQMNGGGEIPLYARLNAIRKWLFANMSVLLLGD